MSSGYVADRQIRAGDHVRLAGWPGLLFVLDAAGQRLELLGPGHVRIVTERQHCTRVGDSDLDGVAVR
ncbi:MAG: hypothetical protein JJU27_13995 [Gammaproteobacteria bacterium]|nr:hypothetical protein [Gammaproteobacteria bacterium]